MFKRIAKKQKKREEEEELGLDEEAKEILGMHDTDSDESETDSDEDSDSNSEGVSLDDEEVQNRTGMKRSMDEGSEGDEEDSDDESEDGAPPISTADAVKNPVYDVSGDQDVRACIACPGKLLKNSKMVATHMESAAHKRRFKKFCDVAHGLKSLPEDPRVVLAVITEISQPEPKPVRDDDATSKRSAKRKEKMEALKKKRAAQKAMKQKAKEKREAQKTNADDSPSEADKPSAADGAPTKAVKSRPADEHPKKKRKVDKGLDTVHASGRGQNDDTPHAPPDEPKSSAHQVRFTADTKPPVKVKRKYQRPPPNTSNRIGGAGKDGKKGRSDLKPRRADGRDKHRQKKVG